MKQVVMILLFIPLFGMTQNTLLINGIPADSVCGKISICKCNLDTIQTNEYGIENAEIKNDTLILYVNYGGGCGKVNFELFTNNFFLEPTTQKTFFFLKLEDNDACKAFIHQKITFDLTPYKNMAKGNGLLISILRTDINLLYKN